MRCIGENIVFVKRKHWITMIWPFVFFLVLVAISIALVFGSSRIDALFVFAVVVGFIAIHAFFKMMISWRLNLFIVCTETVFKITFSPFFVSDLFSILIDEIHEIEKVKHGFLENVFDYGDIIINVAALPHPLKIRSLPRPTEISKTIQQLRS